ncbi:MAG TPA: hypothetical protein VGR47_15000 [Terracidiphilus sp.]|nr:hypothetical protein [Terracidiphilus sp.]
MMRTQRSLAAAITLFFVAPLVAEYLLGDFPITWIFLLAMLAPFYGGGALLIRELARGTGRGWPTMLLLGAAYTLIEEGFTTQSLFNPDYLHLHGHFLSYAWIPALGIGGWWTIFMFNVHTFWSMGVSIALVEGLFPARAESPWLGRIGTAVVVVLFVAGGVVGTAYNIRHDRFFASPAQFAGTGIVCILFICAAFLIRFPRIRNRPGEVPPPWAMGAATLLLALVVLDMPPTLNWGAVAGIAFIDAVFLVLAGLLSRRSGWSAMHTLSLGGAGAIAYGLHAFLLPPVAGGSKHAVVLASHVVMFCAALAVIAVAVMRIRKTGIAVYAGSGESATG